MTFHYPNDRDGDLGRALCGPVGRGSDTRRTIRFLTCRRCLNILRIRAEIEERVAQSEWEQKFKRHMEISERFSQVKTAAKNRQSSVDTRPRPLP